ncbi:amidohydrolase [Ornithinibacillus contaminans]|uniref:amidohydrolase n=1 Tax=Ornithinibacillus contaminans TaxID=694055 RepID=UPI00064D8BD7|nr:amidohydrolase [Ornithinibacillus contaminans]
MRKIYTNANFYTFDPSKPLVQAVVIEHGRFIDMGHESEMLLHWKNPSTNVINLNGLTVTPGLVDSHLHLSLIANQFMNLDLIGVSSKKEMLTRIQERASKLTPNEWLLGGGWDENLFTDGFIPSIEELDTVAPGNPLFLTRICTHAAIVNTKALERCHYHPTMSIPEGGTIVLHEQTKKPTGLILESASEIFQQHIPEKSYEELLNAMREAVHFAMKKGLTSVHTNDPLFLGGLEQTYRIYDTLLNHEKLGLRTNLLINHDFIDDLRDARMYAGYGNDTLTIGAIKIFADGAFGRRTALLSEPYSDDPENFGEAMLDQATLTDIVRKARELSMPIAVHTIGDQALENVLDVLDLFPAVSHRDRIIHAQLLRKELIKRLAIPSRVVDIQPRFVVSDFPWIIERLGDDRAELAYAWKTLMNNGVICTGGSDSPVEPIDPLLGIHAAVTRKTPGDHHAGWNPKEVLSIHEAFRLFTELTAYATNEEILKGTISRGKLADMTVLSNNPFTMQHPDELLDTEIEMTIIGGEIHYHK